MAKKIVTKKKAMKKELVRVLVVVHNGYTTFSSEKEYLTWLKKDNNHVYVVSAYMVDREIKMDVKMDISLS